MKNYKINTEYIQLYDTAKRTGDWDAVSKIMLDRLENVVASQAAAAPASEKSHETLKNAGRMAILNAVRDYDPRRAMPASFFLPKIKTAIRNATSKQNAFA